MDTHHRLGSVLVVDDDELVRRGYRELLTKKGCKVFIASGKVEALRILSTGEQIDAALVDVRLPEGSFVGSGYDVVKECWKADPRTAVVMMSMNPEGYHPEYKSGLVPGGVVAKNALDAMYPILQGAVVRQCESRENRIQRQRALGPILLDEDRVKPTVIMVGNDGEPIFKGSSVSQNGEPASCLQWVNYHSPMPDEDVICVPTCDGCGGECSFCPAKGKPFVSGLPAEVITGMVMWAVDNSYLLADLFERPRTIRVATGGMGDWNWSNMKETCKAAGILGKIKVRGVSLFRTLLIATGNEHNLAIFRDEYAPNLEGVQLGWSLHFRPKYRAGIMKRAGTQDSKILRDLFRQISKILGTDVLVYWHLALGLNDTEEDTEYLAELLGDDNFVVKVAPLEWEPTSILQPASAEDVNEFANRLERIGLRAYAGEVPERPIKRITARRRILNGREVVVK